MLFSLLFTSASDFFQEINNKIEIRIRKIVTRKNYPIGVQYSSMKSRFPVKWMRLIRHRRKNF